MEEDMRMQLEVTFTHIAHGGTLSFDVGAWLWPREPWGPGAPLGTKVLQNISSGQRRRCCSALERDE